MSADLSVALSGAPDPVTAGQSLAYTIMADNAGPSDALTVSVAEATPAGTTFASVVTPAGWSASTPAVGATGTVTFTRPTFAAGGTASFTVVVNVDPSATGAINASATVSAATSDPAGANNTAAATTMVATQADVSVSIADAPDPVVAGDDLGRVVPGGVEHGRGQDQRQRSGTHELG
jgi:uncharacterized repeat protein (TIGR01451 family)